MVGPGGSGEKTSSGRSGAPPAWLDPGEDRVWRTLLSVHASLLGRLDEDLRREHDLSLADYDVLVALSESGGGALRMSELAERVMLSPSGLTRRVDRLVDRHLVTRRACPSDGRGSLATLTEPGWEQLRRAAPTHVGGVRRYVIDALSPDGVVRLGDGLDVVATALADHRPGPAGDRHDGRSPDGRDGRTATGQAAASTSETA